MLISYSTYQPVIFSFSFSGDADVITGLSFQYLGVVPINRYLINKFKII